MTDTIADGLEEILAKSDDEIMFAEILTIFPTAKDSDEPQFTRAQMIKAMGKSFEDGKAHIEMLERAKAKARTPTAAVPAELVLRLWRLHQRALSYASDKPAVNLLLADLGKGIKDAIAALPPAGRVEELEALVALADAADKCAEAPHFIVQPFLGIYRKHGETIARARAALSGEGR